MNLFAIVEILLQQMHIGALWACYEEQHEQWSKLFTLLLNCRDELINTKDKWFLREISTVCVLHTLETILLFELSLPLRQAVKMKFLNGE